MTTNEMTPADLAVCCGNNGNDGFGNGNGWWILLLFLLAGNGGWGFGGFGGGGNMMLGYDFPWLLNGQNNINANTNSGFRDAMINDGINSIGDKVTSGFGDVQTALCGGFAGVNASINNAAFGITNQLNANEIASLNRSFAEQTANASGFNSLTAQLAQCCCDNRLATCQSQNLISNEAATTRSAIQAQTQAILDKLCQQEIEQKNDTIAQLRSELMYARGQASQDVQTAAIQAGQRALANEVEQYVLPTPRPAYIVSNPNCCSTNTVCGCGSF